MKDDPQPDPRDPAESLSPAGEAFAEYLAQVEDGASPDFEAFCRSHAPLADELRKLHARWLAYLAPREDDSERVERWMAELRRSGAEGHQERYEDQGLVGRGGMGEVRAAYDTKLRRALAIKTLLTGEDSGDSRGLARFLDEARIMAQLDHPGVIPVHELGLDARGRLYFSMPLIRGRDLGELYALAHAGDRDWTRERLVSALLRVCEAIAFAHSRGVLHRDLKPANVMIGPFGETYVMDWGIAKVLGSDPLDPERSRNLETYRGSGDEALRTGAGSVVGTLGYLAPEQARGEPAEEVDERADVYSIGAMLYELLAGCKPYDTHDGPRPAHAVLHELCHTPPAALRTLAHDVPAELEAICERAMAWDRNERYPSVSALGDDLRAYLEGRVVAAYETGTLAELKKWVLRNRATAAAMALAILFALAGSVAVGWREAVRRVEVEAKNAELRVAREEEAMQADLARRRTAEVLRLSDLGRLDALERRADALWPLRPEIDAELSAWIAEAEAMLARGSSEHRPTLLALRNAALPYSEADRSLDATLQEGYAEREWYRSMLVERRAELEQYLARREAGDDSEGLLQNIARWEDSVHAIEEALAPLEARTHERSTWRFPTVEAQWEHDTLSTLVLRLDGLAGENGLLADVRGRRNELQRILHATVQGDDARARWQTAIAAVSSTPAYEGLSLTPQFGLLPIGQDPLSGLQEFVHVQSGGEPTRDPATGALVPDEAMGVVLVLLPGGRCTLGAQATQPFRKHYDQRADDFESPVHLLDLAPFFLSKYELTQAQWVRARGTNPANLRPGRHDNDTGTGRGTTLLHPVETVSWSESVETLRQLGLALPTEAQWESAARAGTTSPWYTGPEIESLLGHVNAADLALQTWGQIENEPVLDWLDDGWALHAPVGSFLPNPFGLHDVLGNVSEWCADDWSPYSNPPRARDGLRTMHIPTDHVTRGGGSLDGASLLRVSARATRHGDPMDGTIGLRPARALEPAP